MTEHFPGNPYATEIEKGHVHPDIASVYATLALAWEQRTANLIACSQKVYVRDSPEQIRERLGEGVGTPTPSPEDDQSTFNIVLRELEKFDIDFPSPVAVNICAALREAGHL